MRAAGIFKGLVVGLAAAALAGAVAGPERLAPYLPGWLAAHLSAPAPAKDGAKPRGAGTPLSVLTATAEAGSLPITRRTIGTVVPQARTELSSQSAGVVAKIVARDGAEVTMGDLVLTLDDRAARADLAKDQAALAKDQAALEDANDTHRRVSALIAKGVGTDQAGEAALAQLRQAEASVQVAKAQIAADLVTLANTEIRAPFSGRIGALKVAVGTYVAPGTAVATLIQAAPVYAEFALAEPDLALARAAVAAGQAAVTVSPYQGGAAAGPASGEVVFIDNAVDSASGTFILRALLPNADLALWPGQSLQIDVTLGRMEGLTLVPTVAVLPLDGATIAFVVNADGKAERREVTLALREGDLAGVSDGLFPGDQVVIEGQDRLTDGAAVTVSPQ